MRQGRARIWANGYRIIKLAGLSSIGCLVCHGRIARVFGSVLHGLDTDNSDLDILIDSTPETTLFDIGAIRHKLGQLLGVPVDVLSPNALPDGFRATVLAEARSV